MEARLEQVALQVVAADGLEALTMHRLAREVGVTPGALYRYVDSREALIGRLLVRVLGGLATDAQAAMTGGPLEQVWAACAVLSQESATSPYRFGLLALVLAEPRVLVPDPGVSQPVMAALLEGLAPIITALDEAKSQELLDRGVSAERALVLFTALVGVLSLRKQERHGLPGLQVDHLARQLVATLLVGWGADHTTLPESLSC